MENGHANSSSAIQIDPEILSGSPSFPGTRVHISSFLNELAGGRTLKDFQDLYPWVSLEQMQAVLDELNAKMHL